MTRSPRRFSEVPSELPPNLRSVFALSPSAMTLGLGNIHALLARLGHPERGPRTVVVAGTNGKGSVTAMTAALLQAQGLRVGRYISPHVYSASERVAVNGEPVTVAEMEEAAARVVPLHEEIDFSYFEAITAIAFLIFARRGIDVAVLETGLGGRFDATNVTSPEATVITSISLDHRRLLGDTEEEILREKLGITRPGVPLLIGPLAPGLEAAARERGRRDGFPVRSGDEVGTARTVAVHLDRTDVELATPRADYGVVTVPFAGPHQVFNVVLAVGAAEHVAGGRLDGVAGALAGTHLPGRFEVVPDGATTFVLDVAHNEGGLNRVFEHLAATSPREQTAVVFGLLRRKELFEAPRHMVAAASRIHLVTALDDGSAYEPHELLARHLFRPSAGAAVDVILWNRGTGGEVVTRRMVDGLRSGPGHRRVVVVTGSHHVVDAVGRIVHSQGVPA